MGNANIALLRAIHLLSIAILLLSLPFGTLALASEISFSDYPAPVYFGENAKLRIDTEMARQYRGQLYEASSMRPNFAGHFVLSTWGCGAQCQFGAVIDLTDGTTTFLPGTICCWSSDAAPFDYHVDSRLLIMRGEIDEHAPNAVHFFVLGPDGFKKVAAIPSSTEKIPVPLSSPVVGDPEVAQSTGKRKSLLSALFEPSEPDDFNNVCQGRAAFISVEELGYDPPATLIPDVGADGETPHQEWNLMQISRTKGIVLHCYAKADDAYHLTFRLPQEIDRCRFMDGLTSCSSQAQRIKAVSELIEHDPQASALRECLDVGFKEAMLVISKSSRSDAEFYAKVMSLGGFSTIGRRVGQACNDDGSFKAGRLSADYQRTVNTLFAASLLEAEDDFYFRCRSHAGDAGWSETVKACAILANRTRQELAQ